MKKDIIPIKLRFQFFGCLSLEFLNNFKSWFQIEKKQVCKCLAKSHIVCVNFLSHFVKTNDENCLDEIFLQNSNLLKSKSG